MHFDLKHDILKKKSIKNGNLMMGVHKWEITIIACLFGLSVVQNVQADFDSVTVNIPNPIAGEESDYNIIAIPGSGINDDIHSGDTIILKFGSGTDVSMVHMGVVFINGEPPWDVQQIGPVDLEIISPRDILLLTGEVLHIDITTNVIVNTPFAGLYTLIVETVSDLGFGPYDIDPTPTLTFTPTSTTTSTSTYTITPTASITPSVTETSTQTLTGTPTKTVTSTPTYSHTPTITQTGTITGTSTVTSTRTQTPTSTRTATMTTTPTSTITCTATISATHSRTPTVTPTATITTTFTITQTSTFSPTNTVTPTITKTVTITPSISPTGTSSPAPYQTKFGDVFTYPSPAKGDQLWFYYRTQAPARIEISIYNIVGEKVDVLFNEHLVPGQQRTAWDIRSAAPGIYLYHMKIRENTGTVHDLAVKKIAIMKIR